MNFVKTLEKTTEYAREYRLEAIESLVRNNHMNEIEDCEVVQQRHIDAILVDFINYVASKHSFDYALYTEDLK